MLVVQISFLRSEDLSVLRSTSVNMVLGTDMKKHFDIMSRFQVPQPHDSPLPLNIRLLHNGPYVVPGACTCTAALMTACIKANAPGFRDPSGLCSVIPSCCDRHTRVAPMQDVYALSCRSIQGLRMQHAQRSAIGLGGSPIPSPVPLLPLMLQAAFKRSPSGSVVDAPAGVLKCQVEDWDGVKAEDKTLVHQASIHLTHLA